MNAGPIFSMLNVDQLCLWVFFFFVSIYQSLSVALQPHDTVVLSSSSVNKLVLCISSSDKMLPFQV